MTETCAKCDGLVDKPNGKFAFAAIREGKVIWAWCSSCASKHFIDCHSCGTPNEHTSVRCRKCGKYI